MNELRDQVGQEFHDAFGHTPLTERIDDILKEAIELSRCGYGRGPLKGETGDLLCSLLALCYEEELDIEELVGATLNKISDRKHQYAALGRKTKVALIGGAFDPPTIGHIKLAQFVLNTSRSIDEVWLVPCNRHMYSKDTTDAQHRLAMCELAASVDRRIKVFDYEIRNKMAGETYYFLKRLLDDPEYDNYNFSYVIGMDNAVSFDRWFNYELVEKLVRFIVVNRPGISYNPAGAWYLQQPHLLLEAENRDDLIEVSSTEIRDIVAEASFATMALEGKAASLVIKYILENKLYV